MTTNDASSTARAASSFSDVGTADADRRSAALAHMLREGVAFDPLYPTQRFGSLTDHLPMALTALAALDASPAQLAQLRTAYVPKLVPERSGAVVALVAGSWREHLGVHTAYPSFRALFMAELARDGRDAVLRRWLPRLVDAVAVDALHPLIRVAAALAHDVDAELAAGLAYWCTDFAVVPAVQPNPQQATAAELFARLHASTSLRERPLGRKGFGARLKELAGRAEFAVFSGWRPPSLGLDALAREAARVYLGTSDFFALHMVTGSHALRGLLPYLDDPEHVLDRWWQALAATYVIIGAPDYSGWQTTPAFAMPTRADALHCAMAALTGDDFEHVVKVLWSAREEHRRYGFSEHASIVARLCVAQARQ